MTWAVFFRLVGWVAKFWGGGIGLEGLSCVLVLKEICLTNYMPQVAESQQQLLKCFVCSSSHVTCSFIFACCLRCLLLAPHSDPSHQAIDWRIGPGHVIHSVGPLAGECNGLLIGLYGHGRWEWGYSRLLGGWVRLVGFGLSGLYLAGWAHPPGYLRFRHGFYWCEGGDRLTELEFPM